MENEKALVTTSLEIMDISAVKKQVNLIQQLMKDVMEENEHYGTIPGTKKAGLWKSGAEKLSMTFRLVPKYQFERIDMENGHREIVVTCTLINAVTGEFVGEGVGSCSTMESKYRYRNSAAFEITDDSIPDDAKENKAKYRKQGFGMQKDDNNVWVWVKYSGDGKVENPDIADVYNTVLKMAKKRAHIDAVLTATAASDIFTQDYDDSMTEENGGDEPRSQVTPIHEWITNFDACRNLDELKDSVAMFNINKHKYTVAEGVQIGKAKDKAKDALQAVETAQEFNKEEEPSIQQQADADQAEFEEQLTDEQIDAEEREGMQSEGQPRKPAF